MNTNQVSPLPIMSLIGRAALAVGLGLMTSMVLPSTAMVMISSSAHAQEADAVSASQLAGIGIPSGAMRVRPDHVPQEVTQAFHTLMESAGNTVKQGRTELIVWETGKGGAKAGNIKSQIAAVLRREKWEYEERKADPKEGAFTMVTALQTAPTRRALIGFWVPTEGELILAWTEMLPANEPAKKPAAAEERSIAGIVDALRPAHVVTPPVPEQHQTSASNSAPTDVPAIRLSPTQYHVNVMKNDMPPIPAFPKLSLKPGVVRGYVKDIKGQPIAGALIGVRSTSAGGFYSGASGKSDAKGYYEVAAPWGAAHFYTASVARDYADGRAALGLHPADGEVDSFATAKGMIENWVLLPYGVADRDAASDSPQYSGNYYGGSLTVGYSIHDPRSEGDTNLPDGSDLEIKLAPVGKLFDGSAGKTIVIRRPVSENHRTSFYINNVPIGTYQMSARLITGSKTEALRLKETGPYSARPFGLEPKEGATTATLTFRPGSAKTGMSAAARSNWESLDVTVTR